VVFPGAKDDVLDRYCGALNYALSNHPGLMYCIRATGDNPFVFADAAERLLEEAVGDAADYAGYQALPYGTGVEVVKISSLFRAQHEAVLPAEREHVCPYLYNNGDKFRLYRPSAPAEWRRPEIRLTIDTQKDYDYAAKVWKSLEVTNPLRRYQGISVISAVDRIVASGRGT
jgi:spore coat polysaccharide biosynthesis protein SpsF